MIERFRILSDATYVRYGAASLLALGCDVGLFMALLAAGLDPAAAAALGYSFGILIHWLMSSRLVFSAGVAQSGTARNRQKALFLASAFVGLALTTGIVTLGEMLGVTPLLAKGVAIGLSFQVTYFLRKLIVFA